MNNWWVYIIDKRGKFYVGVTTDLQNRMRQHDVTRPLYFEGPMSKAEALKRERILKGCRREKKLKLIINKEKTIITVATFTKSIATSCPKSLILKLPSPAFLDFKFFTTLKILGAIVASILPSFKAIIIFCLIFDILQVY